MKLVVIASIIFLNVVITGDSIPNSGGLSVNPETKLTTIWGSLKRF